jgi:hypothetical protein
MWLFHIFSIAGQRTFSGSSYFVGKWYSKFFLILFLTRYLAFGDRKRVFFLMIILKKQIYAGFSVI